MGLLIDSTAFIHAERRRQTCDEMVAGLIERFGNVSLAVSVMTAGELLHGCWRADTPARRAQREEFVESMLSVIPVVPITLPVIRLFAETDAKLRSGGRTLPTSDLLIASTALLRGDDMATGNVRHFDRIPRLTVHKLS